MRLFQQYSSLWQVLQQYWSIGGFPSSAKWKSAFTVRQLWRLFLYVYISRFVRNGRVQLRCEFTGGEWLVSLASTIASVRTRSRFVQLRCEVTDCE